MSGLGFGNRDMLKHSMKRRFAFSGALLAAALFGAGAPVTLAQAQDAVINISASTTTKTIKIAKGKPRTIHFSKDFFEIVIGDPEIANVTPLTDQSFYVLGHKLGTTGIALFDENKQLVGSIDIEVTYDTAQLNATIAQNLPESDIRASTANGQVVLSGDAKDQPTADKARTIAKQFNEGKDVIDSVKVTSSQQVQLDVRFVEVNRQAVIDLGAKYSANAVQGINGLKAFLDPAEMVQATTGQIVGRLLAPGVSVDVTLKALENKGLARRLAEPNLIARSGEKASFLAGGEFPIPVAGSQGSVTVEFKKYGVGLEFSPKVLSDGLIALDIAPEVSAIDTTNSYKVGNIAIPGFIVRRAKTSVDLRDGQSFMIAGLLQTFNDVSLERIPGIGKAPVIGSLFSSKQYQRRETELVIIVTPHLIKPIDPSKKMATPLDKTLPPSNADLFGANVDEIKVSAANRAKSGVAGVDAGAGHFLELQ
jgi:pilus assembly protein CpaC